jgi:hypothetical protein
MASLADAEEAEEKKEAESLGRTRTVGACATTRGRPTAGLPGGMPPREPRRWPGTPGSASTGIAGTVRPAASAREATPKPPRPSQPIGEPPQRS